MILQRASEFRVTPIDWLWPGSLTTGSLTILDGDPGQGKSLLSLDLAARLTTCLGILPGDATCSTTLAQSTDDGLGTVIRPNKLLQQIGEGGMGIVFVAEQQPVRRNGGGNSSERTKPLLRQRRCLETGCGHARFRKKRA
jgi:hypothetical protein